VRDEARKLIGFASTVWLWTSLSGLTLIVGLSWAGLGLVYPGGADPRLPPPDTASGHH
jgi:hypothetical protein